MWIIEVKFIDWGVWKRCLDVSRNRPMGKSAALAVLEYEQARSSWPMRLRRIK